MLMDTAGLLPEQGFISYVENKVWKCRSHWSSSNLNGKREAIQIVARYMTWDQAATPASAKGVGDG